ncbi:hypothetical protein Q5530_12150 [Saccharothrix sp. BKS2]
MTPIGPDVVAVLLWRGEDVVDHARGTEAQMCAQAHRWAVDLQAGRRSG